MGELDTPSVPTYCSMYRARCWGNRRHGHDLLHKVLSQDPELRAPGDVSGG